jgi:GT2 family glycosyltransferase
MNYSISVVIPNYNGKNLLEENIPFVISALKTSQISDYEIIVSDDNSVDDSVIFIKNTYPFIKLIENKQNKGFAGNTNIGILAATKDLVFILNSDVQLTNGYFLHLLPLFDKPDTFGVMGKIIGLNSDDIQDGAKYPGYSFGDIKGTGNYIHCNKTTLDSLFMSGANSLVDRNKILEIGCFNEIYNPYYWEDVDLGIRARKLGYKIYYESRSICRHPNATTIKKEPSNKVRIISKRNKMFLHYLHLDGVEFYYFLFKITLKSISRLITGDKYYLKSYFLFISSFPELRIIKRKFKNLQTIKNSDKKMREIIKEIKNNITPSEIKRF